MANMSYCRFENTAKDFKDCLQALEDGEAEDEDLSEDERDAKARLVEYAQRFLEELGFELHQLQTGTA